MFRDFLRGILIDPELEKKAHEVVDRAGRVSRNAEKLINDAKRKMKYLNGAEVALVVAGCLIASGVVIGTLNQKLKESSVEN
ncbi:MAG: hypothetical protein UT07_C0005G0007 [Parcubacteria group bacterium GW2011_GWB1_38_8]|uniref:Uncharacterized protein n=1 Tax=Candidatus Zambryskibacteria bacterium RIFCSPLOWO2_02_FULL_39_14 TaxID=1802769 RepID=A0A1G2UIB2_9BACT|nr:MAG: hypothetical protein UT07_C0005G0007 [Parcubacteria group bacterium GW2011_GWB1_38_8]OHA95027.1 MAG: hypothetical protein A3C62_01200 [Candidatus Zambryskibacteria bacterium RIFCSPHIGHO2_02_FULL_39_16]OHB08912.1 MAG: hypothetical protein A3I86_02250 [Candidatus Zambryskibacteria bacterium RIFCSPLOWO2_02_FULL_39_14]